MYKGTNLLLSNKLHENKSSALKFWIEYSLTEGGLWNTEEFLSNNGTNFCHISNPKLISFNIEFGNLLNCMEN